VGYTARFSGRITITPPLSWAELRNSPGLGDLRILVHEDVTDHVLGQHRVLTGTAIVAAHDFPYGGYAMLSELEALASTHCRKHIFSGFIEAAGDEGDRWRLTIRDGRAVRQVGTVVWHDEGMEGQPC